MSTDDDQTGLHGIDFDGFLAVFCERENLLAAYPHVCPEQEAHPVTAIEIARKVVSVSLAKLAEVIREACPGPHAYVQHRDRKPAWCEACGYAEDGTLVSARLAGENTQEA